MRSAQCRLRVHYWCNLWARNCVCVCLVEIVRVSVCVCVCIGQVAKSVFVINTNRSNSISSSSKMSAESIQSSAAHGRQGRRSVPVARGGPLLVGYLLATVFVVGTLCAWQENVRPKLYVTLGKLSGRRQLLNSQCSR